MKKRAIALMACAAFLAPACSEGRATEAKDGSQVRWIDVDGATNRFNGSFLAYFPDEVSVRAGDTVVFNTVWTGEPHTVTMGKLVDKAFDVAAGRKKAGPVPLTPLPQWTLGQSHFLPANVGRPCYLEKGRPPKRATQSCAVTEQPAFNGRQQYYSSGFLPEGKEFRVRLSKDIEEGTYRFFCSFHGARMSGQINVVTDEDDVSTQAALDEAGDEKLRAFVDETLPTHYDSYRPFERARAGRFPWPALASFETNKGLVKVLEFVPYTIKAKENEEVRWSVLGAHTIAFDAPENAQPPAVRILSTGETELKADAVNESRSEEPPEGAPRKNVVVESGPYDEGFLSSGILYSPKRRRITYVVRFTEPGSYRYQCLLHPNMTGLVIVSV